MRLTNKVAVVTGAASGIGKEIALVYAKAGAKIAIAHLMDPDQASLAAEEIKSKGGEAMAVAMNVIDENQVDQGIDQVVKHFGSIDVLVSNAGIQIIESVDKLAFSDWKKLLAIQLDGAFLTTGAALRHMYTLPAGAAALFTWVQFIPKKLQSLKRPM